MSMVRTSILTGLKKMLKTKFTLNVIGYIIAIVVCILVFNSNAKATGSPYETTDVIGYTSKDEPVTFGEFYNFIAKDYPELIDECQARAGIISSFMNNRLDGVSLEDTLAEVEKYKTKVPVDILVEFQRLARESYRQDSTDVPDIENFLNFEYHQCLISTAVVQ